MQAGYSVRYHHIHPCESLFPNRRTKQRAPPSRRAKAERGRFFSEHATFNLPVYLDDDTCAFVEDVAQRRNLDVSTVVNDLIRSDRDILKVME